MKKLFLTSVIGAVALVASAAKDPNAFADYTAGMATDKASPSAVEWHDAERVALDKDASEDVIATFVEDEASAKALLAKVKPAYVTDPMVAVQAAAVSQYVMTAEPSWWEFWTWFSDSPREIWTKALLDTASSADNAYVVQFCVDQLRWCAYPEQAADLCAIGKKGNSQRHILRIKHGNLLCGVLKYFNLVHVVTRGRHDQGNSVVNCKINESRGSRMV